jgi:peroxiredoxin
LQPHDSLLRGSLAGLRVQGKDRFAAYETAIVAKLVLVIIRPGLLLLPRTVGVSLALPYSMLTTLSVFLGALAAAQPAGRYEALVPPQLARGQELVYSGTYEEDVRGATVQSNRLYAVESRAFVLDSDTKGSELAVLTVLRSRAPRGSTGKFQEPSSVRLVQIRLDRAGHLSPPMSVPLDGPPTVECGQFIGLPLSADGRDSWDAEEPGRPPQSWRIAGTESRNGLRCVQLKGAQQSDDWDNPRADRIAWRRRDTVWVAVGTGLTCRVERTIERREVAHTEPMQKLSVTYDLESRLTYPGQLYEDRFREIAQARALSEAAAPYLRQWTAQGERPLQAVLSKISYHLDNQPETPYRQELLQLRRRIDAARRGETVTAREAALKDAATPRAATGQPAPDFIVSNLLGGESLHLRRLLGKPIVLVFYSPASPHAHELLRFANSVAIASGGNEVRVLALAMSNDRQRVSQEYGEWQLGIPIGSGLGLRHSYDVEATPKIVIIDGSGIVRRTFVGWGSEIPHLVSEELTACRMTMSRRPSAGR